MRLEDSRRLSLATFNPDYCLHVARNIYEWKLSHHDDYTKNKTAYRVKVGVKNKEPKITRLCGSEAAYKR